MGERHRCRECGEVHGSLEALESHYSAEHPEKDFDRPAPRKTGFKKALEALASRTDPRFLLGVFVGSFLTAAAFTVPGLFAELDPVTVTVVSCDNCSYGRFVNVTDRQFDAEYAEVDYRSDRGKRMVEKYNISYVPAFVFEKSIESRENFTSVRGSLVEYGDAYVLSHRVNEAAQRFSTGKNIN